MKKYKLLKNLPGIKSGTVFIQAYDNERMYYPSKCFNEAHGFLEYNMYGFHETDMQDIEFFQEINEEPSVEEESFTINDMRNAYMDGFYLARTELAGISIDKNVDRYIQSYLTHPRGNI